MIKPSYIAAIMLISISTLAQKVPTLQDALNAYGLSEQKVISNSDTVTYYLKKYNTKPRNLVVFIQGTDPNPIFFYQARKDGTVELIKSFSDEYKSLDPGYAYAIIAKPGLSGIFDKQNFVVPEKYNRNNYKQYRVNQINVAIEDIRRRHLSDPKKIIVYGHSEGAQIGANLATVNKNITHLGFWSGNVLNNFYEFALFERIAALKKNQTDSAAHANILQLLGWYGKIIKSPSSTELDQWGYTNKRWSSYEEAPINELLHIDIPIFAIFATEDESTPIETAYLLPVQFMQNRKDNLTFELCMNCDHSYREMKDGRMISHWNEIFERFIRWTD
jgi:pimeloyl-ACP methyl ester carboxylesterase